MEGISSIETIDQRDAHAVVSASFCLFRAHLLKVVAVLVRGRDKESLIFEPVEIEMMDAAPEFSCSGESEDQVFLRQRAQQVSGVCSIW